MPTQLEQDLAAKLAAQAQTNGIALPSMGAAAAPGGPANIPPPPPAPPPIQAAPMVVQGQAPPLPQQGLNPFAQSAADLHPRPPPQMSGFDLGLLPQRATAPIDLRGVHGGAKLDGDVGHKTKLEADFVKPGAPGAGAATAAPRDWDKETDAALGLNSKRYEEANTYALDAGINARLAKIDESGHVQDAGEKIAQHHAEAADLLQKHADLLQKIHDTASTETQRQADEYERMFKESAEDKVDPNAFYKGKGGLARGILDTIAVGLGTMGSGLAHTPNQALEIVNGHVQANIDAQKANIAQRGKAVEHQKGLYLMAKEKGLSDEQAENLQYQANYAKVQKQLEGELGKADTQQKVDQIQQAMKTFDVAQAERAKATAQGWGQARYALMHPKMVAPPGAGKEAELNAQTEPAQEAVAHTLSQGEEQPGYGLAARAGRWLSGDNGVLTTAEGRAGQRETKDLAAQYLALTKRPLRGSAVDDFAATIKTPEDKIRLAHQVKRLIEASQVAKVNPAGGARSDAMDEGPELEP